MNEDGWVTAVHTVTNQLQLVPEHWLKEFDYFKRATKAQISEANTGQPAAEQPEAATKEGAN